MQVLLDTSHPIFNSFTSEDEGETSGWTNTDTEDQHATARTVESLGGAIVRAAQASEGQPQVVRSPTKKPVGRQVCILSLVYCYSSSPVLTIKIIRCRL